MTVVQCVECSAECELILSSQAVSVVDLLEYVRSGAIVEAGLLSPAVKSVLVLLAAPVVVDLLETTTLLDSCQNFSLLVCQVLEQCFGEDVSALLLFFELG